MSPRAIFLASIALYAISGMKAEARKPQEPNQAALVSLPDSAAVDIADEAEAARGSRPSDSRAGEGRGRPGCTGRRRKRSLARRV
jgi:hypothetical protein